MALNRYEVLIKVAEIGNISKVAEQLNYSQPAISHVIKNMESEYQIKLFQRDANGIRVTHAGKELLGEARAILRHEQAFEHTASLLSGVQMGKIAIGSFSSVSINWMPNILKGMRERYPNIEIFLSNSPYHIIERNLREGTIDCGFISSRYVEQCDFYPLCQDEYYILLPDGHPLEKYEAIPLEALEGEKMILMNDGRDIGSAHYDTANIISTISPKIVQTVEDDFVALAMVKAGLGITILPKLILDCADELPVIKRFAVPRYRTLGIAVRNGEEMSPLTKLFISFVQEYVEEYKRKDL